MSSAHAERRLAEFGRRLAGCFLEGAVERRDRAVADVERDLQHLPARLRRVGEQSLGFLQSEGIQEGRKIPVAELAVDASIFDTKMVIYE